MKYRLYVDEVGHDCIKENLHPDQRYLSLTGVIAHLDHIKSTTEPALNSIKNKYFPTKDPDDKPIIFHRSDILGKKGCFGILQDPEMRAKFDSDVISFIRSTDFTLITVVLDKVWMQSQDHWRQKNPYHFCMQVLIEKYVLWLHENGATGDIMPEERKGKKDKMLSVAFEDVYNQGTHFVQPAMIQERLAAKTLKFRGKQDNVTGLQLCDLLASPSYKWIKVLKENKGIDSLCSAYERRIITTLLESKKYNSSSRGTVWGYGYKHIP